MIICHWCQGKKTVKKKTAAGELIDAVCPKCKGSGVLTGRKWREKPGQVCR